MTINSLFGRFCHLNLYAQIGLIVVLGVIAYWCAPIGLDRFFPLGGKRQILIGVILSICGWGSLVVILLIIANI